MRTIIIRSNQVAPDSRVEKEAAALAENGINVRVLAWDRRANHPLTNEILETFGSKIPILRFGHKAEFGAGLKSLKSYLAFQWNIFWWLIKSRKDYDIIHSCDFDTAFTATLANIFIKKRFIFDIFDYIGGERKTTVQKILCHIQNHIINRSDATIICTEDRERQIRPSKPKNLTVIHNSPPRVISSENGFRAHNPIRLCYVGILQDYRLLQEIPEFFIKHNDYELHIGGFGKYEQLYQDLSRKYANIKFYGRMNYIDTLKLEYDCDIMLAIYDPRLNNHVYAAPNKFYEALMIGRPLIMAKNTGMSDVVRNLGIGEVIDYSYAGFEKGVLNLASKVDKWDRINRVMLDTYNQYSWDEMKMRLVNLYDKI